MTISELSDKQLVKAFKETVLDCQHKNDAYEWQHTYTPMEAELLCRLGAVSASPQPRCPKCRSTELTSKHIGTGEHIQHRVSCSCGFYNWIISHEQFAQFFAAAPAHTEPDYNRAYTILADALNLNPEYYGLVEMAQVAANRLTGKYDSSAQEQPVENSPVCPKCSLPTKPMYGDEAPSEWEHHCPEPSPQKGKP